MKKILPILLLIGCTSQPHKFKTGDEVIVGNTVHATILKCWNVKPRVKCNVMFNNGVTYTFYQDELK